MRKRYLAQNRTSKFARNSSLLSRNPDSHSGPGHSFGLRFFIYLSLLLGAVALLDRLTGCSTTPSGLQKEQQWYQRGTNAVNELRVISAAVPNPFTPLIESGLGLATAALAAWSGWQQKQLSMHKEAIKTVANGNPRVAAQLAGTASQGPAPHL